MAILLKAEENTEEEVFPKSGPSFTLEELQTYVGGYLEPIYLLDGRVMLVEENAKLRMFGWKNFAATAIARNARRIGPYEDLIGDIVICTRAEMGD